MSLFWGYDVDTDAQRFLAVQTRAPGADPVGITVVENWYEAFKQRRTE